MEKFNLIIKNISDFAWGPVMIILLVGTGLYLTIGTRFVQFRKLTTAFKLLFSKNEDEDGDISPFQALMTSLAATIGTGNIAGVASAIASGGPGAIFWMWITAFVGGATKYSEALLAIKYRKTNENGEKSGGPMYYITMGFKEKYGIDAKILGSLFAFFGVFASFGIGNMVQSNSVARSIYSSINVSPYITGLVITFLASLVILGGIKSIGKVSEKIVPTMALLYIMGALIILFRNYQLIPNAFNMIFSNAFTGKAVGGGLIGTVIRYGVARGVFSNEAGLGSAPIAHAASKNNSPIKQGIIGSLGSFIDTLTICTITALVILVSGLVNINSQTSLLEIQDNLEGAALTTRAFDASLPYVGQYIVSFGLVFFAFSTILGWYYYGSKCLEFLAGVKSVKIYKYFFIVAIFIGSITSIDIVWNLSDAFNGLMALPNLIALIFLSPIIFKMTKDYDKNN